MLFSTLFKFPCGKWLSQGVLHLQVRHKVIQPINSGQIQLIKDILDLSYKRAYTLIRRNPELRTLDQDVLKKTVQKLCKMGIRKEEIVQYPKLLKTNLITTKCHAMVLEEGGFSSVTAPLLSSFIIITRKPVKLLKAYNFIPDNVDVVENFLSFLEDRPPPLNQNDSDENAFKDLHIRALCYYLCWKLEMSEAEFYKILKTYPQFRNRSLRLIEKNLKILQEEVGFSKEKIRRNGYLLSSNPDNTLNTLKVVKSIGDMDFKTLCHRYPKLLSVTTETFLNTRDHIKNFGIPDTAIGKCPEIFTLSSDTVKERLKTLNDIPEFVGLIKHPRVLRLVHYQRKARSRLYFLQGMKFKCMSLHLMQAAQFVFERHVNNGADRTNGSDIVKFLAKELECSESKIRKLLHRHPYWCNVPLMTVQETLNFLFHQGFKRDQILFNVQVVLYSSKQLQKILCDLPSHPELKKLLSDKEDTTDKSNVWNIPPEQKLAFCLYFIERDYHFTGDGVWFESGVRDNATAVG